MALLMRKQGISYRDLEFLTGLSAGHLNRIAKGERVPSRTSALAIARALRSAPATVFPDRQAPPATSVAPVAV